MVKRNKGHYIMRQEPIHQEYITIVNIYAPDMRTPKYIKKSIIELQGEINSNVILIGKFNNPPLNNG